jgi:steroid 5-alpha reductase family enzyme
MTEAASAALLICLIVFLVATAGAWLLSVLTREYSWVDRFWSLLPPVYLWVFALCAGLADPRLNVLALLGSLWGIRLTMNLARKGGYAPGGEDYRWATLRRRMHPVQFALFNLFFISIYQNLILLLITLPAWVALGSPGPPFGAADVALTVAFLACLAGESVADRQQWDFQQNRRLVRARGGADPGFLTTGLFRFSRHPNYFFEILMWWLVAGFGVVATGSLLQVGSVGAALLTLLFAGSIAFTESISMQRHPDYAAYRNSVWPLVPWAPKRTARTLSAAGTAPGRSAAEHAPAPTATAPPNPRLRG